MHSSSISYESIGSTSSSLLERVRARDEQAWQRLVQLYAPLVLYWCRLAGLPREDRADVAQEVFRAVARHIGKFHRDCPGDSFRGWLHTVTRSKLADFAERRHHCPEAPGGSTAQAALLAIPDARSAPSAEQSAIGERALMVHGALEVIQAEFEERTWRAFWRTAVDGLTSQAVADELGMTAVAVRMAKSRVLARLRAELEGLLE